MPWTGELTCNGAYEGEIAHIHAWWQWECLNIKNWPCSIKHEPCLTHPRVLACCTCIHFGQRFKMQTFLTHLCSSHHSGCDPSWCNDVLLMHVMTCLNTCKTKTINKSVTWGEATWGTQHLCIRKEIVSTNQIILVSQMIPRNIFSRMGAAWRS